MTSESFKGDVYESSTAIPSPSDASYSLIDEGYWHENDLRLAAELGKALLDRNIKLELALEKSMESDQKKQSEIELLTKEITHLRELSQEKMAFVDEVDRYNQELDQNNRKLLRERADDKSKIRRLLNTISALEEQVNDLSEQLSRRNLYLESLQTPNRKNQVSRNLESAQTENTVSTSIYIPPDNKPRYISRCFKQIRDNFIDDDFQDQPELGAHMTYKFSVKQQPETNYLAHRISNKRDYWNVYTNHKSHLYRTELHRSISWPQLGYPIPINLGFELETSDQLNKDRKEFIHGKPKFGRNSEVEELNNISDPDVCETEQLSNVGVDHSDTDKHTDLFPDQVAKFSEAHNPNNLDDSEIPLNSESAAASDLNSSIPMKFRHVRLADEIEDLLDDVSFLNCLDRIYNPHIRSQYNDLIREDYKPHYKQLFHEAFQLLNRMRNTKFSGPNPSHSKLDEQIEISRT